MNSSLPSHVSSEDASTEEPLSDEITSEGSGGEEVSTITLPPGQREILTRGR